MCEMDAPSSDSRAAWRRPGWIFFILIFLIIILEITS
jgi:hypothetical protein